MPGRLFIFGSGGHSKQVIDIFQSKAMQINGLFDDHKKPDDKYYLDHLIIDTITNAPKYLRPDDFLFCAIGDN